MGRSGAQIQIMEDCVMKWAEPGPLGDRVAVQGIWLVAHGRRHAFLPRASRASKDLYGGRYEMERLVELPSFVDDETLVQVMISKLRRLWDEPLDHEFDLDAHIDYVRARAGDLADLMQGWARDLAPWMLGQQCVTHGDPTIDNCMLRGGGELGIIDPLPPSGPHLPSVRALDIGKILQSAFGYEEVSFGRRECTLPWIDAAFWEDVLPDVDTEEWQLCLYMAAVHLLRLIPYSPLHKRRWMDIVRTVLDYRWIP